jgi:hypothetical protein
MIQANKRKCHTDEHPPAGDPDIHGDVGDAHRAVPHADPDNRSLDAAQGRVDPRSAKSAFAGVYRHGRRHNRVLRLLQGGQGGPRAPPRLPDPGHMGLVPHAVHRCPHRDQVQEVEALLWHGGQEESADEDELLRHRRLGHRHQHGPSGWYRVFYRAIVSASSALTFNQASRVYSARTRAFYLHLILQ